MNFGGINFIPPKFSPWHSVLNYGYTVTMYVDAYYNSNDDDVGAYLLTQGHLSRKCHPALGPGRLKVINLHFLLCLLT